MNQNEIDTLLKQTLLDSRLSQSEKKGLGEWVALNATDDNQRGLVRSRMFALARAELGTHPEAVAVLGWLEEALRLVNRPIPGAPSAAAEESRAFFSPGDTCLREITHQLGSAKQSIDLCVFTITDDRITSSILAAHKRGVKLRIVTDNEKAGDLGSDVERLESAGIPVRIDRTPYHMHHKYAIFDGKRLLDGSYNWTRGAAENNEENIIVTTESRLVQTFMRHFEGLWEQFK